MAVLLVVLAVLLVAAAGWLLLKHPLPWPCIGVAALTSATCFTVGGSTGQDLPGPDVATAVGGIVGLVCVVCAILSLVPRDPDRQDPSRVPAVLATIATVVGAVGLAVSVI